MANWQYDEEAKTAMKLAYHVVDVFTTMPFEGNALAVFPDATGVDSATMQRIARELNLAETSFILPRESSAAATRVRIFTPAQEMEFAGHPTLGTAYMMRKLRIVSPEVTSFALEENVGLVPVRVDSGDNPKLWLQTPPIRSLGVVDRGLCAAALSLGEQDLLEGVMPEGLTAGNPGVFVAVRDAATVDRAIVDTRALFELLRSCEHSDILFVFAPVESGAYSRMFAPELGVVEDPATGSATGPLAAYMMKHGLVPHTDGTTFVSEQGTKMGRRSLLHVLIRGDHGRDAIEIGGNVTYLTTAEMIF